MQSIAIQPFCHDQPAAPGVETLEELVLQPVKALSFGLASAEAGRGRGRPSGYAAASTASAMAMDADTYLRERVEGQLTWLEAKSQANKNAFMRYRIFGIILGALITILSPYAGREGSFKEWIPPALQLAGVGVALSGALLALNRHQENWLRYRGLKESLEREKMLYLTASTPAYASPDAFGAFVRTVEDLMTSERTTWLSQSREQDTKANLPNQTTKGEQSADP